jgi:hypothetical protein
VLLLLDIPPGYCIVGRDRLSQLTIGVWVAEGELGGAEFIVELTLIGE